MGKARIRRELRAARHARLEAFTSEDRRDQGEALREHWADLTRTLPGTPALFAPTASEPDVRPILRSHTAFLLPRLTPGVLPSDGAPAWWCVTDAARARLLDEPGPRPAAPHEAPGSARVAAGSDLAHVSAVLLPALAVDLSGTRLGQGGGWYDRALLHLPTDALRVAVVLEEEVLAAGVLPREEHDLPVHAVITPSGTHLID